MHAPALDRPTPGGRRERMPVLFVGHGSPMNAVEDNEFSRAWKEIGTALPRPEAVLCISAHWETRRPEVTAMERPRTIHDFYGFPPELSTVAYPAPGSPALAERVCRLTADVGTAPDHAWGLDHGAWSVLARMFPAADVPVVQLALDRTQPTQFHYDLGRRLRPLRDEGVLILGSGNIVHNLGMMVWRDTSFAWATEFDDWAEARILAHDHAALVAVEKQGDIARLAVNSQEHYLPLLYSLAASFEDEPITFFTPRIWGGSISMRSITFGA